jgi:competence protein ComEA
MEENMEKNKVNINRASRDQLARLDGIGGIMADEIIEYRLQHGGFKEKDELHNLPDFDNVIVEKIKEHIYIG